MTEAKTLGELLAEDGVELRYDYAPDGMNARACIATVSAMTILPDGATLVATDVEAAAKLLGDGCEHEGDPRPSDAWCEMMARIVLRAAMPGIEVADIAKLRELQAALEATDAMSDRDANACREIVVWVRDTFGAKEASDVG